MPNLPISGLPPVGPLTGAELYAAVQGGVTSRVDLNAMNAFVGGQIIPVANLFAGHMVHPGYVPGTYYPVYSLLSAAAANFNSTNFIRLQPFFVTQTVTIDEVGAQISTVAAGSNFQLAIFGNDPTLMRPTGMSLAWTPPTLPGSSTGAVAGTLNVPLQLQAGVTYWYGVNTDNSAVAFAAWNGAMNWVPFLIGAPSFNDYIGTATVQNEYFNYTWAFANGLNTVNIIPANVVLVGATVVRSAMMHFRVSSVP